MKVISRLSYMKTRNYTKIYIEVNKGKVTYILYKIINENEISTFYIFYV